MAVLYLTNIVFTEGNSCRTSREYVLSCRYCKHSICVEFVSGVAISFSIENAKISSPSTPLVWPTAVVESDCVSILATVLAKNMSRPRQTALDEIWVGDRCQNAVTYIVIQWQVVTKTAVQTCQQSSAKRFATNQPFRTYFFKFVFRSQQRSY